VRHPHATLRKPQAVKSLGSERGLATPSPDGKGEKSLGPSMKIMPGDSYSTLGRSCEPAYQVDLRCAGLRGGVRSWPAAGPPTACRAATRRPARLPDREAHLSSSRRGPGPDPASDGRGRGLPARRAAPNSGYSPVPSGAGSVMVARPRVHTARHCYHADFQARRAEHARPVLDHASCDPPLRADRPRQRAFEDVPGDRRCCRTASSVRHSATGADPPFH